MTKLQMCKPETREQGNPPAREGAVWKWTTRPWCRAVAVGVGVRVRRARRLGAVAVLALLVSFACVLSACGGGAQTRCGAPCEDAPARQGWAVTFADGTEVIVSPASWEGVGSRVRMTVTVRNTGRRVVGGGALRIWAAEADRPRSLPMDRQDRKVEGWLEPGQTVEVGYHVRVDKMFGRGRLRVFVAPGDHYASASWYVGLPEIHGEVPRSYRRGPAGRSVNALREPPGRLGDWYETTV